jgi:DNA-directed RNA polymerase subunit H (RpoH/RPB5)
MSANPLLLPVRKDIDTVHKTVLTNILKMLCNRKWILSDNLKSKTIEIINTHNDEQVYKIRLDISLSSFPTYDPQEQNEEEPKEKSNNKKESDFEDNIVMVKLLPQKITSVSKSPIIMEFFSTYKKFHKILIVDSISDKSKHQLISNKYTEVFTESFFMLDILEHVCSPKYEVLSPLESKEMLGSYHLLKKQMKRMFDTDQISLYFFLKKRQIIRIIRNSELTGGAIDYRIVVPHKNS